MKRKASALWKGSLKDRKGAISMDSGVPDKTAARFAITAIHQDVTARAPGASKQAFETAASAAKSGCPVSKVLRAEITMDAKLEI
jgi:organic hydroperoxide reductase OsmC/OhrA